MLSGVIDSTLLCCDNNFTWIDEKYRVNYAHRTIPLEEIIYRVVIPAILISGILGNILVLIVLSSSAFRGIAYLYLRALAFTQICVLVFWIPISLRLAYKMNNNYPTAFYHAYLELVTVHGFAATNILIMACLIVDRYIFVFLPSHVRAGNARKNVKSFIWSSFAISFTVSAPLGGMRRIYERANGPNVAFILQENTFITRTAIWKMYVWMLEIVVRIAPAMIIVLLNILVVKRFLQLDAKKRRFNAVSEKFRTVNPVELSLLTRNRSYKEEQHLIILTTTIVMFLILSMVPAIFVPFLRPDNLTSNIFYEKLRLFSIVIELGNFAIHIFIYLLCSSEFRAEVCRILQGRCNENVEVQEQPVGENEDFSRHGTTVRLTPELTKLNSPTSPTSKAENEEKELQFVYAVEVT